MKVAILLGSFSIGTRPLDFHFDNIWTCLRGLTGTDLATVMTAKNFHDLGHDVSLFTIHAEPNNKPLVWEGVKLYNFIERHVVIDDTFDAVISINEPDAFRGVDTRGIKICWQFLNDFSYCQPDFDSYVDLYLSPCQMHLDYAKKYTKKAWDVVPLGCEPSWYEDRRVYGRVVWTSSCDRGLHWLVSQWPKIKEAVPEATLKIFYHFSYGSILDIEPNDPNNHPHVVEMAQRLRYIRNAIHRLKPLGLEQIGSVSRADIAKELSEASVFGFSADTVAFTEGFSVSALEAHASHTVPVMTDVDCLGSIYNDSGAVIIKSPIKDRLPEFTDAVIKGLTDKSFADAVITKCMDFAKRYTWMESTKKLEAIIKSKNENK